MILQKYVKIIVDLIEILMILCLDSSLDPLNKLIGKNANLNALNKYY